MERLKKHHISFKNAWSGVHWSFTSQPNFMIHLIFSITAVFLGIVLGISKIEWLIIILSIVFGLGAEMINTSIEAMCNLITTDWKKEAKIVKDVSAGMMLIIAVGTLIIGLIIFIPKLLLILPDFF